MDIFKEKLGIFFKKTSRVWVLFRNLMYDIIIARYFYLLKQETYRKIYKCQKEKIFKK